MAILSTIQVLKVSTDLIKVVIAIIDVMNNKIDTIFDEIAKTHYKSAKQALESSAKSNTPNGMLMELRVSLGHLRDTYNFFERYKDSYKTKLFGLRKIGLDESEKYRVYKEMVEISFLISVIYFKIKDIDNSNVWKRKCISIFPNYEHLYEISARGWSTSYEKRSTGYQNSHYLAPMYTYDTKFHSAQFTEYMNELKKEKEIILNLNQ